MDDLKRRTASGLLWGGFSNGMVQLLGALFGIVLLRLLQPDDYGKMAALVIFGNIASCLQESGFTAALANKVEPRHEDYNAVFWFNVLVGATLYVILFAVAPLIAAFYHEPILCPLGRVVFLSFVFSSLGTAQRAWLFGHLKVRETSIAQLAGIALSGVVGIALAWMGWAYWALAVQSLTYVATLTVVCWCYSPWRPSWHIDLRPAWQMFGFSVKLLVNTLALHFNNQAFGVLLNRFQGPMWGNHTAGIYSNARKWDDMAIQTISGMVQGIAQPTLRRADTDSERLVRVFRKLLRFTGFVAFPCLLGLALVAEDFIVLVIGAKWQESARLLSLLCLYGAFAPITTLYSGLVISRGKSGINMTLGLVSCVLVWGGIITMHALGCDLTDMVAYYVALNIGWVVVWQCCARRLIGMRHWWACQDILPFFGFAAACMAVTGWATAALGVCWLRLGLRIGMAAVLYVGILWVCRATILRESVAFLRGKRAEDSEPVSHGTEQEDGTQQTENGES